MKTDKQIRRELINNLFTARTQKELEEAKSELVARAMFDKHLINEMKLLVFQISMWIVNLQEGRYC